MRTSDLLSVVGMTSTAFTAVLARGVLPFEKGSSGGWSKFGVEEAIRLAIFMDLTAQGMLQAQASKLLRDEFDGLLDFLNADPAPPPGPVLFGEASFGKLGKGDAGNLQETTRAICAIAGTIDQAIARAQRGLKGRWELKGLTLVSASDSMGRILPRLTDADLLTLEAQKWAAFMRAPESKQSWRKGQ
ncbi:MAG: hypothetical protein KKA16_03495 [Alphaproteobacteria bacterium]|nr:hypothetical protein [Alphaproteobacteria bacterium]